MCFYSHGIFEQSLFRGDVLSHCDKIFDIDFNCIPGASLCISPIDTQIAYKLFLGSDKDIEDAVYLWEIFKNDLDHNRMKSRMKEFGVTGEDYGIIV